MEDHGIPLTLLYKALADTVGLSELGMRLPVLAFGLAAVAIFPLLIRGPLGRRASGLFAGLLAIAPVHVYYSRYARAYSIALFLAFVGVVAFVRWWSGSGRRWAALYAAYAVLAPWWHLAFLPGVLAPLAVAAAEGLWRPVVAGRPSHPALLRLGSLVAAGLVLLLAAPTIADWQGIALKLNRQTLKPKWERTAA